MGGNQNKKLKCCLAVVVIISVIAAVAVGAVVWKLTKDAYASSTGTKALASGNGSVDGQVESTTSSTQQPTRRTYTAEEIKEKPWLSTRLPRDVIPVHYDVTLFPNFYDGFGEFSGNSTIEVNVTSPTRYILLHVHTTYMNVTGTHVTDNTTGDEIDVIRTFYHTPHEFFVIQVGRDVMGFVKLTLQFQGTLNKTLVGFYKSSYLNTLNGQTRNLAASKFEPTYARRAFPCFDEPNIKAEFTITLIHRPEYIALSNMPQVGNPTEWGAPDLVVTKFQRSVRMSTYLVCFVVCDFPHTSISSGSGLPIRVFSAPDRLEQTEYALGVAQHALEKFTNLFHIGYPLPKLDLIGIPEYESGATEHWGLITFRESTLLYNSNSTALAYQEHVAQAITHEISHQWFGNLVTMDWWNDLWLNEGMASFLEYEGVLDLEPDWDSMTQFLATNVFKVMKQDSELASHPIVANIVEPNEISSVFDDISYSKGSSVTRMLKAIIGHDNFYSGISKYLNKFQFSNAKTDDLWQCLSEADGSHNVKHLMETWIMQDGFPYINITAQHTDQGQTILHAQQARFLANPESTADPRNSPFGYRWVVSLDYRTCSGANGTLYMDLQDANMTITNARDCWIKFNVDNGGYYIVLYPDEMWSSFAQHLTTTPNTEWRLTPSDRAGLLHDAFALAGSGKLSYEIPLDMLSYLQYETHYVPWSVAMVKGASYVTSMLRKVPEFSVWKKFLIKLLAPAVDRLGYEEKGSSTERLLRGFVINLACSSGEKSAISNITTLFRNWLDYGVKPPMNIRMAVHQYGMRNAGSDDDWEKMWDIYQQETSAQEQELLAYGLGHVRDPYLISRLLTYARDEVGIKRQDFFSIVQIVGLNSAATDILWEWTRENYQLFTDRFTVMDSYFAQMIYEMVKNYNSEFKLREVKDFFDKYPDAGAGERYRKLAIESIERNIYWMKHFKPVVIDWLRKQHF